MEEIKKYLERNSKTITEIIEDQDTYKIEDISDLTKLNCLIAETLLKIEGVENAIIQTSKSSTRANKTKK